jgi:hypothetical protein
MENNSECQISICLSVYLSFLNNKIKVMVSFKCYVSFEKGALRNLQRTA